MEVGLRDINSRLINTLHELLKILYVLQLNWHFDEISSGERASFSLTYFENNTSQW